MKRTEQVNSYLTTREAAKSLGISLRTAQLWVENGQLDAWKTDGGHRRISRASVQRLLDGAPPAAMTDIFVPPSPERIRVLVVEDDSILLKLYKTVIASWNLPIDVITAGNGIDGLIRVGKDAPDLMITDLSMPGMDGIQLIRLLAASSFREGLEIVVVSGLDKPQIDALGGLPADIRLFSKPVPFVQLKAIVSNIVERRAAYL
ncbi:MAG: response regulator [Gammaproteobacteria bacterium]|nr:response regulator [Gammaproteobacteria bacterium]MBU1602752.1 response regulator [Gammaproteobacteria bacterium]MBU2432424.1 response regulator [Gammaproteobacteria bacterium]MBU2449084.1 response regulator [Gammaproteobacteria bacterium]